MQEAPLTMTMGRLLTQLEASKKSLLKTTGSQQLHRRKLLPQIDKEEVKRQVKQRYRQKWRDSGYVNREFQPPPILKPKILNNWEMERIYLSRRSYQCPKDFKGMKTITGSGFFPQPQTADLPPKLVEYIRKRQHDYIEAMYDPSDTLKTYESKIDNVRRNHQSIFKRTNTIQNNAFGLRSSQRSISHGRPIN